MGAGLTIEDVNTMQDEMNKIEDPAADEAAKAEADRLKAEQDAKVAEDKAKADADAAKAAKDKEDAEAAAKAKEKENEKENESDDSIISVRAQLRLSEQQYGKLSKDYQRLYKIMVDKGLLTQEEIDAHNKEEKELEDAFNARQEKLTEMIAVMEVNPVYADVRKVCTQGNLDDVIDAFSRFYVKEHGGDVIEVAAKMEQEIWAEANPYKRMYEIIKKYHPKFASPEEKKKELTPEEKAAEDARKAAEEAYKKGKKKEPVESNDSAAKIGAGGSGASGAGWTAAKIDALPEDELNTVPRDIYDKYLKGQLA